MNYPSNDAGTQALPMCRRALSIATHKAPRQGRAHPNCTSQHLVETLSSPPVSRFELFRTDPAEMAVAGRPIVKGIDVGRHVGGRQLSILLDLLLDPLFLQAAEARLGEGIVPAVALPAGAKDLVWCRGDPLGRPMSRTLS